LKPDLIGYLLDALSEDEKRAVEEAITSQPELRAHLEELRRSLIPSMAASEDVFEPPRGLAERTISAVRHPIASLSRMSSWSYAGSWRLVDVVLVASLLLVVGCLILPAMASLRGDEGRLRCADNLRQLGIALEEYQAIEGGRLPSVEPAGPLAHAGVFTMMLQARELMPDVRLLVCPMADNAVVYVPRLTEYLAMPADSLLRVLQAKEMAGSYGYALGYVDEQGHHGPPFGQTATPLVSDRPPRSPDHRLLTISPNHLAQGQNVLFADGHVRWLGDAKVGRDDLFRNDRGEVGAGLGPADACIGVGEAVPFPSTEP
jgi:prepilin-type processing-associated H-X9-DG protein